jgi:hypothetical protein
MPINFELCRDKNLTFPGKQCEVLERLLLFKDVPAAADQSNGAIYAAARKGIDPRPAQAYKAKQTFIPSVSEQDQLFVLTSVFDPGRDNEPKLFMEVLVNGQYYRLEFRHNNTPADRTKNANVIRGTGYLPVGASRISMPSPLVDAAFQDVDAAPPPINGVSGSGISQPSQGELDPAAYGRSPIDENGNIIDVGQGRDIEDPYGHSPL